MTSRRKGQLLRKKKALARELITLSDLVRGSLVRGAKKCGRKGCKCEKGPLHPHVVISTHRGGKTHIVYVPKAWEDQAQAAVAAYKRAWAIIEELSAVNVELLKAQQL